MTTSEKAAFKRGLQRAFSEAIRDLREKHPDKPTQEQLAASVGMDRTYWGSLERGKRSLTLFNLWRMAQAFGISPSRLVLAVDRQYRRTAQGKAPAAVLSPDIKRLRDWLEHSPLMKWFCDGKHHCLFANRATLNWMGLTLDRVLGDSWREFIHPSDRDEYLKFSAKQFRLRQPYTVYYRLRRADGAFVKILQQANPQFDRKGEFYGFVGVMIEVEPGR